MEKLGRIEKESGVRLVFLGGTWMLGTALMAGWLAFALLLGGCSASSSKDAASIAKNEAAADMNTSSQESSQAVQSEHPNGVQVGFNGSQAPAAKPQRKLIYQANLRMEVKDYEAAKQRMNRLIESSGAYITQFSDEESDYERGGTYVIKVPAAGFQSFVDELGKWDYIDYNRQYSANDVTEEHVDLEARLKAQRAVEARLLSFMEKATKSADLLSFSKELADVQSNIEQIVGRMRYLDTNVAMSTIEMRLYQTLKPVANKALEEAFGTQIASTLSQSWDSLVQIVKTFVLALVAILPFACVGLLVGVPIWLIVRRQNKGKKEDRRFFVHKPMSSLTDAALVKEEIDEADDEIHHRTTREDPNNP